MIKYKIDSDDKEVKVSIHMQSGNPYLMVNEFTLAWLTPNGELELNSFSANSVALDALKDMGFQIENRSIKVVK